MTIVDSRDIATLLKRDAVRWRVLGLVEALGLPEGCVGAGFVRNLVWDYCHDRRSDCREADIDVVFFDRSRAVAAHDADLEDALRAQAPEFRWSVKNQARMHKRNGDEPYSSVEDAMRFWPETATAVAAMRSGEDCILIAPFGTDDLTRMILRPTSVCTHKVCAFNARMNAKKWRVRWPDLRLA